MLRGARTRIDEDANNTLPHKSAVKLLALDDRGEATYAVTLAQNLKTHPTIVAAVGHLTTGCTLSAIPLYHTARVIHISPVATGSDLDDVRSPYFFKTILSESQQAISLAAYIRNTMGDTRVALVYDESPLGRQLRDTFLLKSREIGLAVNPIVLEGSPSPDISGAIHEIAMSKAEAIFSATGPHLTALMTRKWPDGIDKPVIFGTSRLISEEFAQLAGHKYKGIMAAHPCVRASDFHRAREIRDRYERRWKYRMDWLAVQTYDAVDLLLWAIHSSGANPDSIREALKGLESEERSLSGLAGPIFFDRNGSLAREITVAEYVDGGWRLKEY
jgi:branched-chain amino acid transport system substrate-binding protein